MRHTPHALKVEALALLANASAASPLANNVLMIAESLSCFQIPQTAHSWRLAPCHRFIQDWLQSIVGLLWYWFLLLSVAITSTMTGKTPFAIAEISLSWVWTCYLLIPPVPSFRREVCVKKSRVVLLLLSLPLFSAWWCSLKWIVYNVHVRVHESKHGFKIDSRMMA